MNSLCFEPTAHQGHSISVPAQHFPPLLKRNAAPCANYRDVWLIWGLTAFLVHICCWTLKKKKKKKKDGMHCLHLPLQQLGREVKAQVNGNCCPVLFCNPSVSQSVKAKRKSSSAEWIVRSWQRWVLPDHTQCLSSLASVAMRRIFKLSTLSEMSIHLITWFFLTLSDGEFIFKFRFALVFLSACHSSCTIFLQIFLGSNRRQYFTLMSRFNVRASCTYIVVH